MPSRYLLAVGWGLILTGVPAQAKTPYEYVDPLIGTVNGGSCNCPRTRTWMVLIVWQDMSFPVRHCRLVGETPGSNLLEMLTGDRNGQGWS